MGNLVVYVVCLLTSVSCPEEAPIMWIVVGVVGGILLLGLVILALIKAFFTMVVCCFFLHSFFKSSQVCPRSYVNWLIDIIFILRKLCFRFISGSH